MIQPLRGSRALLTGASRGLGAVLAQRLAAEGVRMVITARDAAKLEGVRARCAGQGAEVRVIAADVSRPEDRERVVRESGEVDILINNAAIETTRAR